MDGTREKGKKGGREKEGMLFTFLLFCEGKEGKQRGARRRYFLLQPRMHGYRGMQRQRKSHA